MESILSCQTSSVLDTVASKNPSLWEFVDIMKFQFFGFEEYLSKRYLASVLSSKISIVKQKVLNYRAIFSFWGTVNPAGEHTPGLVGNNLYCNNYNFKIPITRTERI